MAVLCFSDLLRKAGLDPGRVKLIRHALSDKGFRACYEKNMVLEYTRQQKAGFSKNYDYWCVFISDTGTLAKLFACYRVGGSVPDTKDAMPEGFPFPQWYQGENACFSLTAVDALSEYEGRLVIDWGKGARMWHQRGTTEKPIVFIQPDRKKVFSGFENLILSYDELKEIIETPTVYDAWHTALSSVNAIYLIADRETGRLYVGSAYGQDGLLGRWACYVDSHHGHNKQMRELICAHPDRYRHFQFSILQILPKTMTSEEIIRIESLYKKKLFTKAPFGMNEN